MENLNMALVSSSSSSSSRLLCNIHNQSMEHLTKLRPRNPCSLGFPFSLRKSLISSRRSIICAAAHSQPHQSRPGTTRLNGRLQGNRFASASSSSGEQTSSVSVSPNVPVPTSSSTIGSPLFWIGVGVGLSALFSLATSSLKKYAMQQAMKTMMNQMNMQNNNQFNNPAFSKGSPFPFPPPSPKAPVTPSSQDASSQPSVTVDVAATKVESANVTDVQEEPQTEKREKKYAFVDVSPEETMQKSPFGDFDKPPEPSPSESATSTEVSQNGAASKQGAGPSEAFQPTGTGKTGPGLSVEALEKMMEDPTVQKMVYPYLPEEMRNPETFNWMLQNPQYRQQLQEMLNNMSGSGEWDKRMTDTLKNFDLNSPEVKQQFDQIGLTPEEVISKIMANPDVALAFQNPRVQAAIMECSQNPMSITKYQNDKEVMDVFNKISELFPGVTG